jgi:hypothetical protein
LGGIVQVKSTKWKVESKFEVARRLESLRGTSLRG